jgi:hypothetical protein
MPSFEWNVNKKAWTKTCICCNLEYISTADKEEDAYIEFRKVFNVGGASNLDGLVVSCKSCVSDSSHGREKGVHRNVRLEEQGGICAICLRSISFEKRTARIDHDHSTGKTRGVLCQSCNMAMGFVDSDDEWLDRVVAYRDKHR